jgi:hypothetical protein
MVVVCDPADAAAVRDAIGEETWMIGELVAGTPGCAATVQLL